MAATSNFSLSIQTGRNSTHYKLDHLSKRDTTPLFQRFMDRTSEISQLLHEENDPDITTKVSTFALHFLSRGSTVPILTNFDSLQRSPLDYLKQEEMTASYYRGDGSSIFQLFNDAFNKLFIEFDLNEKYRAGLIKPNRFPIAMQRACGNSSVTYNQVNPLTSIPNDTENSFFDISNWLQGKPLKGWPKTSDEWDILYLDISEKLNSIPNNSFIGGVLELNAHVGLYLFFYKELSDPISDCIGNMLNYRGNVGSYPEMIAMKKALVKIGVKILTKRKKLLVQNTHTIEDSLKVLNRIVDGPFNPYRALHIQLLTQIDPDQLSGTHLALACEKIYEISIKLEKNSLPFQEKMNEYHHLMEEIILIHSFLKPTKRLNQIILESLPVSDGATVISYNSGMACFDYILETVRQEYIDGKTPVLSIMEGSYYEIQDELRWHFSDSWSTEIIENENFEGNSTPDLLLLDLYPNNVTLTESRVNPVVHLVKQALLGREKICPPLTVVLDTSTTLLREPAIWDIKNDLTPLISTRKIRLILMTSLAKFYSCGFDKYTGGTIVCFNEKGTPLLSQLEKFKNDDPMSWEAERFFSLLISNPKAIESFYRIILKNTKELYEKLECLAQKKDPEIPVIGIPRTKGDAKIIDKEIIHLGGNMKLPLFIRASFPFPHSAIVECGDNALRLTAGLDVPNNIERYSTLFHTIHSAK